MDRMNPAPRSLLLLLLPLAAGCGGDSAGAGTPGVPLVLKDGVQTDWWDAAHTKKKMQGEVRGAKQVGDWNWWYEDQKPEKAAHFEDGVLDGPAIEWYPNGQMKIRQTLRRGKRTDVGTEWYENGQMKSEMTYVDDLPEGPSKDWHENGKLFHEGTRVKGLQEGRWITYHPTGEKAIEGDFKAGKHAQ